MATNPMQKKSRISFILGMLLMLLIAAVVVAFLYMKMENQKKEINLYKPVLQKVDPKTGKVVVQGNAREIYVINRDVKSGEILDIGMFNRTTILNSMIPSNATADIASTLSSYSLATVDGRAVYYYQGNTANPEDQSYFYVGDATERKPIYVKDNRNQDVYASLKPGDKAFFYDDAGKTKRIDIEIVKNAVVAKVDIKANTIITGALIARTENLATNDLRKEEYNVISLPVDLAPGDYVDIRLMLPNGQNYIVTSKKNVSIPIVNGQYLADTIQMNLTEEEILLLSCAIIENYQIEGSKLYATRYTEAGLQSAATITYYPNNEVQTLLSNDPNVVRKAINGILAKRQAIRDAINASLSKNGKDENIGTKSETSITSTLEQRKNYLQTLPAIPAQ